MRAHTIKLCYHRSYTRKTVQGSLWKWVKVSSDVTHRRADRKERVRRIKENKKERRETEIEVKTN